MALSESASLPAREDAVAPVNRPHVVGARTDGVRLREVDAAVRVERTRGGGIVHHRSALVGRRDVVVRQAERVADLVRAHLAHAREHEGGVGRATRSRP